MQIRRGPLMLDHDPLRYGLCRAYGRQGRGPWLPRPWSMGSYLNAKLASPLVPSLNFTTSWRHVPARFLLVFHT